MRIKAKLLDKYEVRQGTSDSTGQSWIRQEMKFMVLHEDWTETREEILVTAKNPMFIDAFSRYEAGAKGELSYWGNINERTYNGTVYRTQQNNMNNWTPQSEAGKIAAEQIQQQAAPTATPAQPQFTPEQLAAAAAMLQQQQAQPQQQTGGLPF